MPFHWLRVRATGRKSGSILAPLRVAPTADSNTPSAEDVDDTSSPFISGTCPGSAPARQIGDITPHQPWPSRLQSPQTPTSPRSQLGTPSRSFSQAFEDGGAFPKALSSGSNDTAIVDDAAVYRHGGKQGEAEEAQEEDLLPIQRERRLCYDRTLGRWLNEFADAVSARMLLQLPPPPPSVHFGLGLASPAASSASSSASSFASSSAASTAPAGAPRGDWPRRLPALPQPIAAATTAAASPSVALPSFTNRYRHSSTSTSFSFSMHRCSGSSYLPVSSHSDPCGAFGSGVAAAGSAGAGVRCVGEPELEEGEELEDAWVVEARKDMRDGFRRRLAAFLQETRLDMSPMQFVNVLMERHGARATGRVQQQQQQQQWGEAGGDGEWRRRADAHLGAMAARLQRLGACRRLRTALPLETAMVEHFTAVQRLLLS